MIGAAFLLLAQAAQASPAEPKADKDVVVTARRLADTERDLAECLARKCPPEEDIAATLAHAENQFIAGDYAGARRTLLASRHRNARFAKTFPVQVSNLLRANARLASLNGLADQARVGTIDTLDALKRGLPHDDARVLLQQIEVGDAFAKQGRLEAATDFYGQVAERAHKLGLVVVEGDALFRAAGLLAAVASVRPEYSDDAKRAMERVTNTTDPALQPFRDGVILLEAQLAAKAGKKDAIDKAVERFRGRPGKKPMLLYAPPIDPGPRPDKSTAVFQVRGDNIAEWADVSFWIGPDGKVRDIEVLRQSKNLSGAWLATATKALAGRRYAPLGMDPSSPGLLRIERYSFVSDLVPAIDSRIPIHSPHGRVEITDLTVDPPSPDRSR